MNRSAQRAAFQNAIQPFFDAQDASDAAAEKAGATRQASEAADRAYQKKSNDATKQAALDLQKQNADDTATAQTAYNASQDAWVPLNAACQALLTNPGAVEQT